MENDATDEDVASIWLLAGNGYDHGERIVYQVLD
jgi:hypothetical protein